MKHITALLIFLLIGMSAFSQSKIRVTQIEDIQGTVIKSLGETTGKALTTNGSGGASWQTMSFLPLSGGTLVGALTGTSATFSGDINVNGGDIFTTGTDFKISTTDGTFGLSQGIRVLRYNTTWSDNKRGLLFQLGRAGVNDTVIFTGANGVVMNRLGFSVSGGVVFANQAYTTITPPTSYFNVHGTSYLNGAVTSTGTISSTAANGWAIGGLANSPRIQYDAAGVGGSGLFSSLNAANGYAGFKGVTFESTATGVAPFVVATTNKVTNLNVDLLDDYSHASYTPTVGYVLTNGCLIATDIPYNSDLMFTLEIEGNGYNVDKFNLSLQGYNYNSGNLISRYGGVADNFNGTIYFFNYNSFLYIWFAQPSGTGYPTVHATAKTNAAGVVNRNRITSITDAVKPTTGVTREVSFIPKKRWNEANSNIGTVAWNASQYSINGLNINTAGTLTNVAYLDNIQTFAGQKTFSTSATYFGTLTGTNGIVIRAATYPQIQFQTASGTRLLFWNENDLMWRYNGTNDATVFHAGNANLGTVAWNALNYSINGVNINTAGTLTNVAYKGILNDTYLPYYQNSTTSLQNSPISTNGTTTVTINGAQTYFQNGSNTAFFGADINSTTLTANTIKTARYSTPFYTKNDYSTPFLWALSESNATENKLLLGGGSANGYASTYIAFITAANTTTPTGTERMRITSTGNVGVNNTNPTGKLDVIATTGTSDYPTLATAGIVVRDDSGVAANTGGTILFTSKYGGSYLNGSPYIRSYKENATTDDYQFGLKFGTRGPVAQQLSMTLTPNGTLQIGNVTAGLEGLLQVNGNITGAQAEETYQMPTLGQVSSSIQSAISGAVFAFTGVTNYVAKFTGLNTISYSTIFDNGTNVGIGTAAPSELLEVYSASTVSNIKAKGAYAQYMAQVTTDANYGAYSFLNTAGVTQGYVKYDFSNNSMSFRVAGTEALRILQNNYVGIGTTAPLTPLQIGTGLNPIGAGDNKTVNFGIVSKYSTGAVKQYNVMGYYGTTVDATDIFLQTGTETSKNFYTGLVSDNAYFNADRFSIIGNGNERFSILQNGNVGIGNTAPGDKLQVNGTVTHSDATLDTQSATLGQVKSQVATVRNPYFIAGTGSVAGTWIGAEASITSYYNGLTIWYQIPVAGAATTTLNLNSLGAKTIYRSAANKLTTHYGVNAIVMLVYSTALNGGSFMTEGSDYDSDSYDKMYWGVNLIAGAAIYDYKICMQGTNGKFYPLTLEEGSAATKTVSTQNFLLNTPILYYGTTTNIAVDAVFAYNFTEINTTSLNQTANISSWTAYQPMYLKGTIQAEGTFKLDNTSYTSWLTQTLPATDDGFVYIRLGYAYATGGFRLETDHPIYHYKNGKLIVYDPSAGSYLPLAGGTLTGDLKITENSPSLTFTSNLTSVLPSGGKEIEIPFVGWDGWDAADTVYNIAIVSEPNGVFSPGAKVFELQGVSDASQNSQMLRIAHNNGMINPMFKFKGNIAAYNKLGFFTDFTGDNVYDEPTIYINRSGSNTLQFTDVTSGTTTLPQLREAYNNHVVSAAFTGSSTKTLTFTTKDLGTFTASFDDNSGSTYSDVYINGAYKTAPNFINSGSISFVNSVGQDITANLNTVAGLTPGSYTNANITVGSDGRLTLASSGSSGSSLFTDSGSAFSYLTDVGEDLGIGYNSDQGTFKLQVNGNGYFSGDIYMASGKNLKIASTEISYGAAITNLEFGGAATPGTGYATWWAGTDGKPHYTNDAGVSSIIGSDGVISNATFAGTTLTFTGTGGGFNGTATGIAGIAADNTFTGYNQITKSRSGSALYVTNSNGLGTGVLSTGGYSRS